MKYFEITTIYGEGEVLEESHVEYLVQLSSKSKIIVSKSKNKEVRSNLLFLEIMVTKPLKEILIIVKIILQIYILENCFLVSKCRVLALKLDKNSRSYDKMPNFKKYTAPDLGTNSE